MPATSTVVTTSLFKYPYIVDRISQMGAVGLPISNYYGMGVRTSGREGQLVSGSKKSDLPNFVFDVFNNTRTTPSMRGRGTGPQIIQPQKTGQITAQGMRFYEQRNFSINELAEYRKLGSNRTDVLDEMGQEYITRQMDDQIRRAMNGREFSFISMLKGGFKIARIGTEGLLAVPLSYSTIPTIATVDYQVPATHKSQIALGSGGADIIDASWDNAATKIVSQLRNLRAVAVERSGLELTDVWCNTTVFNHILRCTEAQTQGGSSFRVWDKLTRQNVTSGTPDVGPIGSRYTMEMQLRALPEFIFHVCDDGLVLPKDEASPAYPEDFTTTADSHSTFVKYLSNTEIIVTPASGTASQWLDMYAIREYIQREYQTPAEAIYGMGAWVRHEIRPVPAYEFHLLDNYCPALKVPTAIYNPTVIF